MLAVADPDLQMRRGGGGVGAGVSNFIFFSALRVSVWSKNNGGGGGVRPSPGFATGLGDIYLTPKQ